MKEEALLSLPYLEIFPKSGEIRYMGYILKLTAGEYEVFKVIASEPGLEKEDIAARLNNSAQIAASSIPVHVFSINRKAIAVGGRKIVGYKRKVGYCIEKNI